MDISDMKLQKKGCVIIGIGYTNINTKMQKKEIFFRY
jgi:hypothetical protein